jgi:hypothetical protein
MRACPRKHLMLGSLVVLMLPVRCIIIPITILRCCLRSARKRQSRTSGAAFCMLKPDKIYGIVYEMKIVSHLRRLSPLVVIVGPIVRVLHCTGWFKTVFL